MRTAIHTIAYHIYICISMSPGNLFTLSPFVLSSYHGFAQYCLWNDIPLRSHTRYHFHDDSQHDHDNSNTPSTLHQNRHEYSMKSRLLRLQQVANIVSHLSVLDDKSSQTMVRFDPSIPEVPLVHVYIATSMDRAYTAHQASSHSCGIACFAKLRPSRYLGEGEEEGPRRHPHEECYFEFNMVQEVVEVVVVVVIDLDRVSFTASLEWMHAHADDICICIHASNLQITLIYICYTASGCCQHPY